MDASSVDDQPFAYLNMAGAGPVSDRVLDRTLSYLRVEQAIGAYDTEVDHCADLDERVYDCLAELLHCARDDVAIFENATRAWIEVVSRVPLSESKRIFTTEYEYAGNLQYLKDLAKRHGLEIVVIPTDQKGDLDLGWLRANMAGDVGLVSIVQVPSCCGIINPVEAIGEIIREFPAVYIIDACQAVGQVPIDVGIIRCDALTGAGRKFLCGPRGTGFAYVSESLRGRLWPGFVDLHLSDIQPDGNVTKDTQTARFLESAERNCAALVGLAQAVEETLRGGGRRSDGIDRLRDGISSLEGIIPIDPGTNRGGIFSFRHERLEASEIVAKLREQGVAAWRIKGSHTPLFMLPNGHEEGVRFSSNKITIDKAERVIGVLSEILRETALT